MITLKYWNSLTSESRGKILNKLFGTSNYADTLRKEYHHSFDYNVTGKMLKSILSFCFIKGENIEVRCLVRPIIKPHTSYKNTVKASPKLRRYYFRMYTESDPEDGETIWEEAYSESEARNMAYDDFHSITELTLLRVE